MIFVVAVGNSSHLARESADWSGGAVDATAIGRADAEEQESACQLDRCNGARRRGGRRRVSATDRTSERTS